MEIIGISGKMGVGKSTFAAHLLVKLGGSWLRRSFADALKEEVSIEFDIPIGDLYTDKTKIVKVPKMYQTGELDRYESIRKILQYWGQKRRKTYPAYWIDKMQDWISQQPSCVEGIVIDDIRFPEEVEFVKDNCGVVIRIFPYDGYTNEDKDISEMALDDYVGYYFYSKPGYGRLRDAADDFYLYWKNDLR